MADGGDAIYSQLERALNLLLESSAKINFLHSKVESKLRELEDEEIAQLAQQSIFLGEKLEESVTDDNNKWRIAKEKAEILQRSLEAGKDKCADLQQRIRELINMKDSLLCLSMQEHPQTNTELLPRGTRIERMVMELSMESTECSICTENVKKQQPIWSCKKCYNIFHLDCAEKCMVATKRNGSWACPYCRDLLEVSTGGLHYYCFCGRVVQPRVVSNVTPHTCGQTCGRGCGNVCHPGPCSASDSRSATTVPLRALPV